MTDVLHLGPTAEVTFQRADRVAPGARLPRAVGTYPLRWHDSGGGAIIVPVEETSAVWLSFRSVEPVALRVIVDGTNAVTGAVDDGGFVSGAQAHVVLPGQRWLDGIGTGTGRATQLTGPPEDGAERRTIRFVARRLRGAAFARWWNDSGEARRANRFGSHETVTGGGKPVPDAQVDQRIEPDPFDRVDWDPEPFDSVEVHLLAPGEWSRITGEPAAEVAVRHPRSLTDG